MKVVLIGVVVCAALFFAGLLWPRGSEKLQELLRRVTRRGEAKGDASAGRAGDWTRDGLRKVRKAGDKSAEAGRDLHHKARGDDRPSSTTGSARE